MKPVKRISLVALVSAVLGAPVAGLAGSGMFKTKKLPSDAVAAPPGGVEIKKEPSDGVVAPPDGTQIRTLPSETTMAADCERYADEATAAEKFSIENFCGFTGDMWSLDRREHYYWCLRNEPSTAQREAGIRNGLVEACREVEVDCIAYGEVAVAQNWSANNGIPTGVKNCQGPRWSDNRQDHEFWCLRATPDQRREETTARGKHLRRNCK